METMGRCLLAAGNLNEAHKVYGELGEKYGRLQDQAGHFNGHQESCHALERLGSCRSYAYVRTSALVREQA